jgi:integral membrane sensor domain MASE1/anti-sigma regulatory factor (Ser/Thr protein kinase)
MLETVQRSFKSSSRDVIDALHTRLQVPPAVHTLTIIGIAGAYFVAAKLGLSLAFFHVSASAVWPPTGIALAALLLIGYRAWPGIFLGALLANLTTAGTIATSLGIASGNTLEGLAGAYLVNRFAGGRNVFERAPQIFRFALLAAVLSTAISATVGVTSLALGRVAQWQDYGAIWLTWWLGDASGALVVTPFLLLWASNRQIHWSQARILEGTALAVAAVVVSGVVFVGVFPFEYLTVPLLTWAAFRFGLRETATIIFILSVVAIWRTLHGSGPFLAQTQNDSLLLLQVFMATMSLVNLPVAAVVAEQKQVELQLRESEERFRSLYHHERGVVEILQHSLLPARFPDIPGVTMAGHYVPAQPEPVGGDWYDVMALSSGEIGLVIGDVAGHGVGAAAAMGKLRNALRAYAMEGHPPEEIVTRLNQMMDPGEMATMLYLVVDLELWKIRYVTAGHPPAYLAAPGRPGIFLEGTGLPLGTSLTRQYREESADLPTDSILLLYTDGLIESRKDGVETGLGRLENAVQTGHEMNLQRMAERVATLALQDQGPGDDVALLIVRFSPLDERRLHLHLPARPASAQQVRHTLRRWLVSKGVNEEDAFRLTVATGEATANAIEHAYGLEDAMVEVEATDEEGDVTIMVRDSGAWQPPRARTPRGRGFQVMRGLMDQVDVYGTDEGTSIRLSMRVHPKINHEKLS